MEDTMFLIERSHHGDKEAREILVQENTGLVWSIVRRYMGRGTDSEDLFQIGIMGLIKAIDKFDLSYQVKFSTYAVPMIAGEIKRFMRDDGSVKVSRAIKYTAKKMNVFIEEYSVKYGRPPTVKEIAEEFGVEESEAVFIMGSSRMPVSIYEKGEYKDEDSRELLDRLPSVDDTDDMIERLQLKSAIADLPERERKIIFLRYFRDMTQSEVAEVIGVSQVQISRIESRIVSEMKEKLG